MSSARSKVGAQTSSRWGLGYWHPICQVPCYKGSQLDCIFNTSATGTAWMTASQSSQSGGKPGGNRLKLWDQWRPKTAARSREQADSYVHHCGFIKFLARKQMKWGPPFTSTWQGVASWCLKASVRPQSINLQRGCPAQPRCSVWVFLELLIRHVQ